MFYKFYAINIGIKIHVVVAWIGQTIFSSNVTFITRPKVYRCDRVSIELLSVLVINRSSVGHLLVICWSFVGHLLVICWSSDGHLLVICWLSVRLKYLFYLQLERLWNPQNWLILEQWGQAPFIGHA